MNSEFWACFKCGDFLRGSQSEIQERSKQHHTLCTGNRTERENIMKIVEGLHEFSSELPPPPPPSVPKNLLHGKTPWFKQKNILEQSSIQKENISPDDPRSKMPVCVVNELKNFHE